MEFKDIKIGDKIYILECCGTFRKLTTYNTGLIVNVSLVYDDNTNPYLAQLLKKKLIDITISCEGVLKKLTVDANKNIITDNNIGLTVATEKEDLITLVTSLLKEYEDKIASILLYKNEVEKCKNILLQLLNVNTSTVDNTSSYIRVSN